MPTPRPIIAASCGAKSAVSKTWVPSVTRLSPTPSANRAVTIGSPIATTEPKVSSRTTIAASRPIPKEVSPSSWRGFLDRLAAELDLKAGAVRAWAIAISSYVVFVEFVGGDVELDGRVGDLAVLGDRGGAAALVGTGDFADVGHFIDFLEDALHLPLHRRRSDPASAL